MSGHRFAFAVPDGCGDGVPASVTEMFAALAEGEAALNVRPSNATCIAGFALELSPSSPEMIRAVMWWAPAEAEPRRIGTRLSRS